MKEKCKIENCNASADSSTGLCHEHEVEARMREADEEAEYEAWVEREKEQHLESD